MKSFSRLSESFSRLSGSFSHAVNVTKSAQPYIDRTWEASRRCFFSLIFLSLVLSKLFHIGAHLKSLTLPSLLAWGPTFFLVDVLLILIARGLTRSFEWRTCRDGAALATVLFSVYVSSMISSNISFYVHTGAEIHWRKPKYFHRNKPTARTVLSALTVAILVDILTMAGAYFATPYLFQATGNFLSIWSSSLSAAFSCCRRKKHALPDPDMSEQIAFDDFDEDTDTESALLLDAPRDPPEQKPTSQKGSSKSWSLLKRLAVMVCSSIVIVLRCVRPHDTAYGFLSGSLPLAPFGGPRESLTPRSGDFNWLNGHTALDTSPVFDWLPRNRSLDGFADWSPVHRNTSEHYNPMKDPLHIPNLQNDLLEPLREVLHNGSVKIKHIILIKLESTRQDLFPFRTDSYIMERIQDSYGDGHIPEEVEDRLSNLTRTAERLTGFETGFSKNKHSPKPYGGISASNAYTAGTYTLKSIAGTVCGVNPIAVNYNLEYSHDIYQPCLPHIFEALNQQGNTTNRTNDWTSWPWHTMWMQSMFGTYDNQKPLMPALGYQDTMTQGSINAGGRKYTSKDEELEGYGYPDKVLKNYIRDAVADAEKNHTRLFLSHLTGNTHQPWNKPGDYDELIGKSGDGLNKKLNRYLNTVAYQDGWLADILEVLEDAGVADETLLVMAGDHGLSLPNDGGLTPNHDPHVSSFHVPLLFSHPKLPQVEVDSAVLSTQILPTTLDLLIESSSLNQDSTKIIKDLLPVYEGQSMLRPLIPDLSGTQQEWHFSVMNPGGTWVSMRSAAEPYRLVVPLKPDAQWRFTNVADDPFELQPGEDFNLRSLIDAVQTRYGPDVAKWLDKAAHIASWWIEENHRRWKFDPENP